MENKKIETDKLYENAGFQKKRKCEWDKDKDACFHSGFITCDECTAKIERTYPSFTAEKQLELIKWLGHRRHIDIDIYNIKGCTIYDISNDYDWITDEHKFMFDSNTFEDALAGLINQMWHSLTEEERQQIKEILECKE